VKRSYAAAHGELDTVTGQVLDGHLVEGELPPTDRDAGLWSEHEPAEMAALPEPDPLRVGEKPPRLRKQRWLDRIWGKDRDKAQHRGRASTERLVSGVWTQLARLADNVGAVPTARVLRLQAPVAGVVLDAELRGTPVDGVLQPFAKLVNKGSKVGSLLALPILVQLVTVNPHLYEQLEPYMEDCVYSYLEIAGPAMERKQKQMQKREEQTGINARDFLRTIFAPVPEGVPADESVAA
jgi:hypothetical protein